MCLKLAYSAMDLQRAADQARAAMENADPDDYDHLLDRPSSGYLPDLRNRNLRPSNNFGFMSDPTRDRRQYGYKSEREWRANSQSQSQGRERPRDPPAMTAAKAFARIDKHSLNKIILKDKSPNFIVVRNAIGNMISEHGCVDTLSTKSVARRTTRSNHSKSASATHSQTETSSLALTKPLTTPPWPLTPLKSLSSPLPPPL